MRPRIPRLAGAPFAPRGPMTSARLARPTPRRRQLAPSRRAACLVGLACTVALLAPMAACGSSGAGGAIGGARPGLGRATPGRFDARNRYRWRGLRRRRKRRSARRRRPQRRVRRRRARHRVVVARDERLGRLAARRRRVSTRAVHGLEWHARRERISRGGGSRDEPDGHRIRPADGHVQRLVPRVGDAERRGDRSARRRMAKRIRREPRRRSDHRDSGLVRELSDAHDRERRERHGHRRSHPLSGLRLRHADRVSPAVRGAAHAVPGAALHGLGEHEQQHARRLGRSPASRALRRVAIRRAVRAPGRARERDRQGRVGHRARTRDRRFHHAVRGVSRAEPRLRANPERPGTPPACPAPFQIIVENSNETWNQGFSAYATFLAAAKAVPTRYSSAPTPERTVRAGRPSRAT